MKRLLALLIVTIAMATLPAAAADNPSDVTDMQALRNAVKQDRRALVGSTLSLTDAEAKKFWPIYDAYMRAVDAANRRRTVAVEGLISRDKPITDLYAKNLANELIGADEAEIKARRTLHNKVLKALPAIKAARYLQLESKIRAVQAYDIAQGIPLIK